MSSGIVKSKRRSFSAAFKLKVISFAEETSKYQAAKKFGVGRKMVRSWCKQKCVLMGVPTTMKCLPPKGKTLSHVTVQ